jgi:hypothetical protein
MMAGSDAVAALPLGSSDGSCAAISSWLNILPAGALGPARSAGPWRPGQRLYGSPASARPTLSPRSSSSMQPRRPKAASSALAGLVQQLRGGRLGHLQPELTLQQRGQRVGPCCDPIAPAVEASLTPHSRPCGSAAGRVGQGQQRMSGGLVPGRLLARCHHRRGRSRGTLLPAQAHKSCSRACRCARAARTAPAPTHRQKA